MCCVVCGAGRSVSAGSLRTGRRSSVTGRWLMSVMVPSASAACPRLLRPPMSRNSSEYSCNRAGRRSPSPPFPQRRPATPATCSSRSAGSDAGTPAHRQQEQRCQPHTAQKSNPPCSLIKTKDQPNATAQLLNKTAGKNSKQPANSKQQTANGKQQRKM